MWWGKSSAYLPLNEDTPYHVLSHARTIAEKPNLVRRFGHYFSFVIVIAPDSRIIETTVTTEKLKEMVRLSQRDCLSLAVMPSSMSILFRSEAVIFRLSDVHAVITSDQVVFVLPYVPDDKTKKKLYSAHNTLFSKLLDLRTGQYFLQNALEVMMNHEVAAVECSTQTVRKKYSSMIRYVDQVKSTRGLGLSDKKCQLVAHDIGREIHNIRDQISGLHANLENILDNASNLIPARQNGSSSRSMSRTPLSNSLRRRGRTLSALADAEDSRTDNVTVNAIDDVLETNAKALATLLRQLDSMEKGITDLESSLNMALEVVCNDMIRVRMTVLSAAFAFSLCALIPYLFGMNLISHLADTPYMFYWMLVLMVAIEIIVIAYFSKLMFLRGIT